MSIIHHHQNERLAMYKGQYKAINYMEKAPRTSDNGGIILLNHKIDNNCSYIEVKGSGIGMSEDKIQKLFQLGKRNARLGTAQETGTRLGLVLVKELVEANGGKISATNQPNEGSTFTICLKNTSHPS